MSCKNTSNSFFSSIFCGIKYPRALNTSYFRDSTNNTPINPNNFSSSTSSSIVLQQPSSSSHETQCDLNISPISDSPQEESSTADILFDAAARSSYMMLSKIGTALQAAAEVVAPPCALVEDLSYHWSQVVSSCQRCQGPNPFTEPRNDGKAGGNNASKGTLPARASVVPAVEETNAPRHLTQMLKILTTEDKGDIGSLTPCLEFLVTERVLPSLASFAWSDRPLGIRQHTFTFLSGVLSHLHHTHLHHSMLHKPLQSMVKAICEMTASPYETEEINFLMTLCEKIRLDHSLVLLYIKPSVISQGTSHFHINSNFGSNCSTPVLEEGMSSSSSFINVSTPSDDGVLINILKENNTEERVHESKELETTSNTNSESEDNADKSERKLSISSIHSSASTKCSSLSFQSYTSSQLCRAKGIESSFPLIDALLNLCGSADCEISECAHEALLLLCAVREPVCSWAIAQYTLFPHYLASKLAETFNSIPKDTECILIEDFSLPKRKKSYSDQATLAAVTPDIASSDSEGENNEQEENFTGKKELVDAFLWLHYCDKVVSCTDSVLSKAVCDCFREIVLDSIVREWFIAEEEDTVSITLALLTRLISEMTSHCLVMSVVTWLCSDDPYHHSGDNVFIILLNYCRGSEHQIGALKLLQACIEKSRGGAISLLVSPWLIGRDYFNLKGAEGHQSSWSDEEDERAKQHQGEIDSPGSRPISRTFAPNNINRIVKKFLCVVPEELQSSGADDFESYKKDAVKQYRSSVTRLSPSTLHWSREASVTTTKRQKDTKKQDKDETWSMGPFMEMLLDLLSRLQKQNYDVNLQVTSVISTLALIPHPHLHEVLLNPSLPMKDTVRTPYSVLREVVSLISPTITTTTDYRQHLKLSRHQLLGDLSSWQMDRDDLDRHFEALIVIEEFCKELASIAHAKYTVEIEG